MTLTADPDQIGAFVQALFPYADGRAWASLRVFHQFDRSVPPLHVEGCRVDGLDPLARRASAVAERAANLAEPAVFAPPICTFTRPDKARAADIHEGFAISVELDQGDARAATTKLEYLLGPATVIVESGSEWIDPASGECIPKRHLHWRLSEPATGPAALLQLADARRWAATRSAADLSGAPVAHPYRWPGSWNRKQTPPRMARICSLRPECEIDLSGAHERLALEGSSLAEGGTSPAGLAADVRRLAEAVAAYPNEATYDAWVRFGYALMGAVGPEVGFALFTAWSARNEKFNWGNTKDVWERIKAARPQRIGAGTLFRLVQQSRRERGGG